MPRIAPISIKSPFAGKFQRRDGGGVDYDQRANRSCHDYAGIGTSNQAISRHSERAKLSPAPTPIASQFYPEITPRKGYII